MHSDNTLCLFQWRRLYTWYFRDDDVRIRSLKFHLLKNNQLILKKCKFIQNKKNIFPTNEFDWLIDLFYLFVDIFRKHSFMILIRIFHQVLAITKFYHFHINWWTAITESIELHNLIYIWYMWEHGKMHNALYCEKIIVELIICVWAMTATQSNFFQSGYYKIN